MAEVRLTAEGVAKYEDRLEYLKTTARSEIAEQIKIARSFGDLSENAEYDAAKIEQARIEYEIVEIETMLRNVLLIDEEHIDTDIVSVGATVTVENLDMKKGMTFQIVGSAESDPKENRISNESPVGSGLLGHKLGEQVDIQTPGGTIHLRIVSIGK
ncbi:MAG: transcription elongation factor GreA [Clostridia bacterium]|nr:transcription elongation factor GreA [Candidatus Pelethousia sp.]NCB31615.1 transcription elongation factor GreA [Clostridia bacterium]